MVKALEGRVMLGDGERARFVAEVRRGKDRRRGRKCMVWIECGDSWSMLVMYVVVVMRVQIIADDGLLVGFSL